MPDFEFDPASPDIELDLGDDDLNFVDYSMPMKVGKWNALISEIELKASKKGDPQFVVTLEIQDEAYAGRMLTDWITYNKSSEFMVKAFKNFIQAALAKPMVSFSLKNAVAELAGRPVIIATQPKVYNGRYQDEIKFYFAVGSVKTGPNAEQPPLPKIEAPTNSTSGDPSDPF